MPPARPNPNARRDLAAPTAVMLPRFSDRLSFLYLDRVRVEQDDTGVIARLNTHHGPQRIPVPTAALTCLLLGPGTSLTARALETLARHGTTTLHVGSGAIRCYSSTTPANRPSDWLERQATAWADPTQRLRVATAMYTQRFPDQVPTGASIAQLRGMEGQRMKALYQLLTRQHRLTRFKRTYDPNDWPTQDPVNMALSAANTCLYGIVHAAVNTLGCTPGLGFIHTGSSHAFIYDIADLYKAELTLPLAFSLHNASRPDTAARRAFRDGLRLFRLLPRVITDIQVLLDPDTPRRQGEALGEEDLVHLWDPVTGVLPAGINYADTHHSPKEPTR